MQKTYRVLAFLIAAAVVVQAAAIAFAMFGLGAWVDDGGVLDKAAVESESVEFDGVVGFMIHGMNGMMVIPLLGLILLVVSFFAKIPGGVRLAGAILGLIVIQVALGVLGHEMPFLGVLHGINALLLMGAAITAGQRAKVASEAPQPAMSAPRPS